MGILQANIAWVLKILTAQEKAKKYGKTEMVSELQHLIGASTSGNSIHSMHPRIIMKAYTLHNNTNIKTKNYFSKIPSLTCVHTLYNSTNINKKDSCQNPKSNMCTYPL